MVLGPPLDDIAHIQGAIQQLQLCLWDELSLDLCLPRDQDGAAWGDACLQELVELGQRDVGVALDVLAVVALGARLVGVDVGEGAVYDADAVLVVLETDRVIDAKDDMVGGLHWCCGGGQGGQAAAAGCGVLCSAQVGVLGRGEDAGGREEGHEIVLRRLRLERGRLRLRRWGAEGCGALAQAQAVCVCQEAVLEQA